LPADELFLYSQQVKKVSGDVMKELLNKREIISPLKKSDTLESGSVIRRTGENKDQQGCFMEYDDKGGMIVVNVIDCSDCCYITPAGIIRLKKGDSLYRYSSGFDNRGNSKKALDIVRSWSLYKKNKNFRDSMVDFVKTVYTPEQILYLKKNDKLKYLFVPLQQKFRIGRYSERRNPERIRKEFFAQKLEELLPGDHITYVALIPSSGSQQAMFYSVGTKPHRETDLCLRSESFCFVPTHGGHIRAVRTNKGVKQFMIDAGSSYIGNGVSTLLKTASDVAKALKKDHKQYRFIPVKGREAFGPGQSY